MTDRARINRVGEVTLDLCLCGRHPVAVVWGWGFDCAEMDVEVDADRVVLWTVGADGEPAPAAWRDDDGGLVVVGWPLADLRALARERRVPGADAAAEVAALERLLRGAAGAGDVGAIRRCELERAGFPHGPARPLACGHAYCRACEADGFADPCVRCGGRA